MMKIIQNIVFVSLSCFLAVVSSVDQEFTDTISSVNITRGPEKGTADVFSLVTLDMTACTDTEQLRNKIRADCSILEIPTNNKKICVLNCSCLENARSFLVDQKKCSDGRNLRAECSLVTGSYSSNGAWNWDTNNASLPVFKIAHCDGFIGGLNVATYTFDKCNFDFLETYNFGEWKVFTASSMKVTFFKLHFMWHVSWDTVELSQSDIAEIEGKFAKLSITCWKQNTTNGVVENIPTSSCLIIKVTGNLAYNYNATVAFLSTPAVTHTTSTPQVASLHGLILGLCIGGAFIVVLALVAAMLLLVHTHKKRHDPGTMFAMCTTPRISPQRV